MLALWFRNPQEAGSNPAEDNQGYELFGEMALKSQGFFLIISLITAFKIHIVIVNNGNKNPLIVYKTDLTRKNMRMELFRLLTMLGLSLFI